MELSGQNVTVIVVAIAVVALLFYTVYKGRSSKLLGKWGKSEFGLEVAGPTLPDIPESAPGGEPDAASGGRVGDIRDIDLLADAKLRGNQSIHVGHNVGTPGTQPPSEAKKR